MKNLKALNRLFKTDRLTVPHNLMTTPTTKQTMKKFLLESLK